MRIELAGQFARFTDGKQSVAGKFELIGGSENVGGLNPRMNVAKAMDVNESIQHRLEHFASFRACEGVLGENLGEDFFRILHHHVKTNPVFDSETADVVKSPQL